MNRLFSQRSMPKWLSTEWRTSKQKQRPSLPKWAPRRWPLTPSWNGWPLPRVEPTMPPSWLTRPLRRPQTCWRPCSSLSRRSQVPGSPGHVHEILLRWFSPSFPEVSAAAAANRAQVQAIEAQSEAVIANASAISLALDDAETLAQNSVNTAGEAKRIASTNRNVSNRMTSGLKISAKWS